jgi:anhydro-N-acetylmuramic acid kinase
MEEHEKAPQVYAGLMSGTSADGVDAALVTFGDDDGPPVTLLAHETLRYSPEVQSRIRGCQGACVPSLREVVLLDAYLGELFAHALLRLLERSGVERDRVAAVGSHGQTLYHHPRWETLPGFSVHGTFQAGNPAVIAERTGLTVVSHFRCRDMAAGGEGAPLAPLLDHLLYHHPSRGRLALNIGGIANVTAIPAGAGLERVVAFDTGPGNVLMDLAVRRLTGGKAAYDANGAWAAAGSVVQPLLRRLLEHPFLKAPPPKSADRETFGPALLEQILAEFPAVAPKDLLATLAAFTVGSVTSAILEFLLQKERYEEVIVSGGGAENPVLMKGLADALPKLMVTKADEYAVPGRAKEAVLMAFLARETLAGRPGNVPSATGARRPVVLGSITPGARFPFPLP